MALRNMTQKASLTLGLGSKLGLRAGPETTTWNGNGNRNGNKTGSLFLNIPSFMAGWQAEVRSMFIRNANAPFYACRRQLLLLLLLLLLLVLLMLLSVTFE